MTLLVALLKPVLLVDKEIFFSLPLYSSSRDIGLATTSGEEELRMDSNSFANLMLP